MNLRRTEKTDKEKILRIYNQAKAYFKENNIDQWQNGYPNQDSLEADCQSGISYVAEENGAVIATAAVIFGTEKTYNIIYEGTWLSDARKYGIIHRIAVAAEEKGKGAAVWLLGQAESMCHARGARYMRADTHEDNKSMQRLLTKCGYQRCGIIYLEDGAKRVAYEKRIEAPVLECCVDSVESAIAAFRGGADRLELCSGLVIGGLSPSVALFDRVKDCVDIPVRVLLRPRFGDFLYSEEEMGILKAEVREFVKRGADGIVIGCLKKDGTIDEEKMRRLIEASDGAGVTLHRAFDMTREPMEALSAARELGVDTILTSGQKDNARNGKELINELAGAAGEIDIMAGAGIDAAVIEQLLLETELQAFHMSGKITLPSQMEWRQEKIAMGLPGISEYEIFRTDEEKVRKAKKMLAKCTKER
ncbi:MAG: copper homeostasis protein CutC [Acetivibrio ethanolgignens]